MAKQLPEWTETKTSSEKIGIYFLTFVCSLVISLAVYTQDVIVNADGVLYIQAASHFVENGFAAAFRIYDWPFYGILIGLAHQATTLSYEHSAYLLNGVLVSAACTAFVAIYSEIGDENARPWLAALLVLALPILNDYRDLIVRDFGFWAFALIALLLFIRFTRHATIADSLAWQLAAIVAVLFRIEGIVFFVAPMLFLLHGHEDWRGRFRKILQSSYLFLGFGLAGAIGAASFQLLWGGKRAYTLELWLSYISPLSVFERLQTEATKLHERLDHLSSTSEAALILISGLFVLATFKIISNAVVPYLVVALYGARKKWIRWDGRSRPVILFLMLSLLPLMAVLFGKHFLSSRHTVLSVLLISLLTFPYVDAAFHKLSNSQKRGWLIAAWAFVALLFLDGVISSGSSKIIMKTGSQWALENIDENKSWTCNEPRLQFYTNGKCAYVDSALLLDRLHGPQEAMAPGYLLLWIGRKDQELLHATESNRGLLAIDSRLNRKGDQVVIFEVTALD